MSQRERKDRPLMKIDGKKKTIKYEGRFAIYIFLLNFNVDLIN
jgi:hypothetical protein